MLWAGRFSKDINKKVLEFTSSLELDKALYAYDIKGSLVHIKRLFEIEIVSQQEFDLITNGLVAIKKKFDENSFKFADNDEDIHMAIERRLIEIIGDIGKKLHTGRSRNDQVVLDVRMFLKDEINLIINQLDIFIKSLVKISEENKTVVMPGYTHLQQAQPILFSHYILAYAAKFLRDKERFVAAYKTADVYPLGAGALAGTPYQVDRAAAAKELGFESVSTNSMDVVSDRDFILDFLYASSVFAVNCSRLAEDFIIYSSQEFGFLEMDDAYTTGSSIMPQKKNPDIMELVRGKSERIIGSLNSFLNVMKGLPMTYNRDLQEDKYYLFNTLKTVEEFLNILPDAILTTKIKKENMKAALYKGYLYATAIADYLVSKNIPFREAHKITGNLVTFCIENKKSFMDLTIDEYKKHAAVFETDIFEIFDAFKIVNAQKIQGGTSLKSVEEQIESIKNSIIA